MAARDFVLSTVSIVLIFLLSVSLAEDCKPLPAPNKYGFVCDSRWFESLGLNIADFDYCNKNLTYQVRAKDLVDRMTLTEKALQMGHRTRGAVRIGLPSYVWWSEALHGVSYVGGGSFFNEIVPGATSFPTVILTTSAFNRTLWKAIGQAVSTEARAMYNLGNAGLTFWSPVVNPVRDPRWGRITETSGEDPFVSGVYGALYVRGLQDLEGQEHADDPNSRPLKVSACCKHLAAYDVDQWHGVDRRGFDAKVTEQDMVETFLPPFEMCIRDGDVSSIMCSYNSVNGIPTCADQGLLKETIRQKWNLNGYIVSDCDSINEMFERHQYLNGTKEDEVAQALKAGLDLNCGSFYPDHLVDSVMQGKVREEELDRALKYLFVVQMRLGFFDGIPSLMSLNKNDICTEANMELAAEAARQGAVLLKNDNATLPLIPANVKTLAVIGPNANATATMIGNYAGDPCRYITPLEGFYAFGQVNYQPGCPGVKCRDDSLISAAVEASKQSDATILVMGTDLSIEQENLDREDLLLPGNQTQLITQVADASKGPVILVIMSAGGVDISFAKNHSKIQGILWAGQPGQEGGRAIADVVFGNYNPGGRLPITWYENDYVSKLPMTSMKLRPDYSNGYPGRTYKFFNGSTVYPFGYGLSYTSFSYNLSTTSVPVTIKLERLQHCRSLNNADNSTDGSCAAVLVSDLNCDGEVAFEVEVKNDGDKDGNEVVMVYSQPPEGIDGTHIKQVVGFERVFVVAKQSQKVKFALNVCRSLSIVDDNGYTLLPSGLHKIIFGTSSESIEVNVTFQR